MTKRSLALYWPTLTSVRLVFVALLCVTPPMFATQRPAPAPVQGGAVTVRVLGPDQKPVKGAKVVLSGSDLTNTFSEKTDASGSCTFSDLPVGQVEITVTAHGFPTPQSGAVTVVRGETVAQQITLSAAATPHPETPTAPITPSGKYVTVSMNAVAGPLGYVLTPSLTSAVQSETTQQQAFDAIQNYNYPSIVVYISSAPLVTIPPQGQPMSEDQSKQETDRNPLWLDASVTLRLFKGDNEITDACKNGSRVQIIGMMPQQTTSGLKNQTAANVTATTNSVAGALTSLLPEGGDVAAATNALNVLFQSIFPPQPIAYQYSNITDNCNFGWFFRPNETTGNTTGASILGLQTGIVMLKTTKDITRIEVHGTSLSAWNKEPMAGSKSLFPVPDQVIGTITLPSRGNIDFDNIAALNVFPLLITKDEAKHILHMDKDNQKNDNTNDSKCDDNWITFAGANKLVGTNATYDYVTNASLNAFLTATSPPAPSPAPTPQPAISPAPKPATAPTKLATHTKAATPPNKPATPPTPSVLDTTCKHPVPDVSKTGTNQSTP